MFFNTASFRDKFILIFVVPLVTVGVFVGCDGTASPPEQKQKVVVPASELSIQETQGHKIADAALQLVADKVEYKETYEKINYPMGDVSPDIGVCTDMVIRSYRGVGIDIQQLLHEDRKANPSAYPTHIWEYKKPDKNIDHRRCQNLVVFFERFAEEIDVKKPLEWKKGDVLFFYEEKKEFPFHVGVITEEGNKPIVCHLNPPRAMISYALDYNYTFRLFRWKVDVGE